jgi:hypothetical protein
VGYIGENEWTNLVDSQKIVALLQFKLRNNETIYKSFGQAGYEFGPFVPNLSEAKLQRNFCWAKQHLLKLLLNILLAIVEVLIVNLASKSRL